MENKWHLIWSIIKSIIRILGFGFLIFWYLEIAGMLLILAEVIGIIEEL
jgi:hypothetical protein